MLVMFSSLVLCCIGKAHVPRFHENATAELNGLFMTFVSVNVCVCVCVCVCVWVGVVKTDCTICNTVAWK